MLNLLVIPLMTYVMVSALFGGLIGMVWLTGGRFVIGTAHYILVLFRWLCDFSLSLPGSVYLIGRPLMSDIVLYMGLILVFSLRYQIKEGICRLGRRLDIRDKIVETTAKVFNVLSSVAAVIAIGVLLSRNNDGMEITFLSVGQGDG